MNPELFILALASTFRLASLAAVYALVQRDSAPRLPMAIYNYDTEQARASIRKLAAMEPAAAWPGHAKPVTGDVRGQLERAADAG